MSTPLATVLSLSEAENVAKFLSDPKQFVVSQGLDPEDPEVAGVFELYAKTLISNVNAANTVIGIGEIQPRWGIGFGCCNQLATKKQK